MLVVACWDRSVFFGKCCRSLVLLFSLLARRSPLSFVRAATQTQPAGGCPDDGVQLFGGPLDTEQVSITCVLVVMQANQGWITSFSSCWAGIYRTNLGVAVDRGYVCRRARTSVGDAIRSQRSSVRCDRERGGDVWDG